ncbi:hypothetical protein BC941DRAFT_451542 [Chlamydoabsidia padenii]|nr:hypothetical protein BC941DRAFT_451542 [Chlamydoabsidia padenii]
MAPMNDLKPFDPFNATDTLDTDDNTTDLDDLSNLLSRQFLQDVDAETIPTTSSTSPPATLPPVNNYYAPSHSPTANNNTPLSNPWRLDESSDKKPWSSTIEGTTTSSLLPSLFSRRQGDNKALYNSSNNNNNKLPGWDRFESYGNDSEFDPTLQFYPGKMDHGKPMITPTATATITTTAATTNQPLVMEEETKQVPVKAALKKLSTLFDDHDEKELEQILASFDYDVERTIAALVSTGSISISSSSSLSDSNKRIDTTPPPMTSSPSPPPLTPSTPVKSIGSPKKRQVCRHYLAGECKTMLQGSCLKGDTCEFAHSLEEIDQVVQYHHHSATLDNSMDHEDQDQYQRKPYTPTVVDFPILITRSNRKSKKSHNKKSFKK